MTDMPEHEMRDGVCRCPNGCGFEELEIGRAQNGVMAAFGAPPQYIRCGACNFNDLPTAVLSYSREEAVKNWNEAAIARATGKEG